MSRRSKEIELLKAARDGDVQKLEVTCLDNDGIGDNESAPNALSVSAACERKACLCLQKILAPHQQKKKGSTSSEGMTYDLAALQDMRMKVMVKHINVDCRDRNGSTPLILAALNGSEVIYICSSFLSFHRRIIHSDWLSVGHKEAVVLLLIYSADIGGRDNQK